MKVIIEGKPAAPAPEVKTVCIDEDSAGQRVDNFLMRHLKGVPKTHIYRMIRSGEVRVNKGRVGADTRLNDGRSAAGAAGAHFRAGGRKGAGHGPGQPAACAGARLCGAVGR